MKSEAAAKQLLEMDQETAAAVLNKIDARQSSSIMSEMDPKKAAVLMEIIAGASKLPRVKNDDGGQSSELSAASQRAGSADNVEAEKSETTMPSEGKSR